MLIGYTKSRRNYRHQYMMPVLSPKVKRNPFVPCSVPIRGEESKMESGGKEEFWNAHPV